MGRFGAPVLAFLLFGTLVLAQGSPAPAPADPTSLDAHTPTAPVEIDGITLFSVRGVSAFPAATRAATIADRIRSLARDPAFSSATLAIEESALGSLVTAGTTRVMIVTDADADLEGLPRVALAETIRQRIADAIDAWRQARRQSALVGGAWRAALATAILGFALWILRRAGRSARGWLEGRLRARLHLSIRSFEIIRVERLWAVVNNVFSALRALAAVVLVLLWARHVLLLFPWTRGIGTRLGDFVFDPVATMARGLAATIPDLFFLAILFLVTRFVLRAMWCSAASSRSGPRRPTGCYVWP